MPLNKPALRTAIETTFKQASGSGLTPEAAAKIEATASQLADAIDLFVRSGTVSVTVAPGIAVTTAGGPTAQSGSTVAPGQGVGSVS